MKYLINNRKFCTKTIKVHEIPDLIKGQYNNCKLDHVWYCDFTSLGKFWALFILEAASKRIIAYQIKESKSDKCSFTVVDCISTFSKAFDENGEPQIIHSDKGGQFLAKQFQQFLAKNDIQQSVVDYSRYKFGNQVIERFFRTLKGKLRGINPQFLTCTDKELMEKHIKTVITEYNSTAHSSLLGISPNNMQDALVLYDQNNKDNIAFAQNNKNTQKSYEVDQIKATVVQKYAGDWVAFFIEWRNTIVTEIKHEIQKESQKIIENQSLESQRVIDHQSLEIKELKKLINILQQTLSEMQKKAFQAEAALKAKQEQRLRRQARSRIPARDPAGYYELDLAIKYVTSSSASSFIKARDVVCLTILYFTGLRISNLLLLQVRHIKQLLEDYKFDLPLIKKKQNYTQTFYIPSNAYSLFEQFKQFYLDAIKDKNDDDFVFTNHQSNTILDRSHLNKSINKVLDYVSKKTHKNIRSHSFRINLTTALIETVGLEQASKIIGHNDIKTTEMYNRRQLNVNDITTAYSKAHELLIKVGKRKLNIRQKKEHKVEKK